MRNCLIVWFVLLSVCLKFLLCLCCLLMFSVNGLNCVLGWMCVRFCGIFCFVDMLWLKIRCWLFLILWLIFVLLIICLLLVCCIFVFMLGVLWGILWVMLWVCFVWLIRSYGCLIRLSKNCLMIWWVGWNWDFVNVNWVKCSGLFWLSCRWCVMRVWLIWCWVFGIGVLWWNCLCVNVVMWCCMDVCFCCWWLMLIILSVWMIFMVILWVIWYWLRLFVCCVWICVLLMW